MTHDSRISTLRPNRCLNETLGVHACVRAADQTLPGKWLVSDFLVNRATEDYDKMLTLSASDIEEIKSKVERMLAVETSPRFSLRARD